MALLEWRKVFRRFIGRPNQLLSIPKQLRQLVNYWYLDVSAELGLEAYMDLFKRNQG